MAEFEMTDISAEVFGKYQCCTMGPDGLWYADGDFPLRNGGKPARGALPSPHQDTPEQTAVARDAHRKAADGLLGSVLGDKADTPLRNWFARAWRKFATSTPKGAKEAK